MKKLLYSLLLSLPVLLPAATPVFYMPMDDSADVIGSKGEKLPAGIVSGRTGYLPGVTGKALNVKRHAYDQVTAVNFNELPEFDCNAGTVSFWFKPHWKETDPEGHWIIFHDAWKNFRYYFIKGKDGTIELSVCAPKQIQILKKNILKKDEWTHIAFTWDVKKSEVRLYINGRESGQKSVPTAFTAYTTPQKLNLWLGKDSSDRFKANVGDGLYDEIKIFDKALSPEDIFGLASGGDTGKLNKLSTENVSKSPQKTEFVFRFKESRLAGPVKLLALSGANRKHTLSLIAMGASGKLSLLAEEGDKKTALDSNYVLLLNEPHKITLEEKGKQLRFFLDGALQGEVTLAAPSGGFNEFQGIDGITLSEVKSFPSKAETDRLSDANIRPVERPLWDLSDAERSGNDVRKGVCLNGYWRVIPVNDYTYAPPAGEWGYMRVPGSFRSPLWQMHRDDKGKLVSTNWTWNKKGLISYRAGWYQRVFDIPAEFQKDGGRIYLNFTNLNGDYGRVYLNGKLIDSFRQDFKTFPVVPNARRLDVTDLLAKDGKNVVTLYIDRFYAGLWRGVPSIGDHGEIALDNVRLESAPSKVSLATALALPSFRRKEASLRARVNNPAGVKGAGEVRFEFQYGKEKPNVFTKRFELNGMPEQVVSFRESWKNPVLWDVENPNLYQMTVSLKLDGKNVDQLSPSAFGFREAWVENGEFRMNGQKMRMRMWTSPGLDRLRYYYGNPDAVGQYVAHIKEMNYDTVRVDPYGKTSQVCWQDYLSESNRQGLYNLFQMPPYEDEELGGYTKEVVRFLEQYGNHPSILMWYTDFNTCGYAWDQDPAKLNDTTYVPTTKIQARKRAQTAEKVMRELDFSRELFQHAGGNSGKIFTSMNYQSFGTPLQEQEDWPKQWSQKHTQPLMVVESAFPYPMQFWHFDKPELGSIAAEHAARYFGDSVFANELNPIPNTNNWIYSPYTNLSPSFMALSGMLYRNIIKAWRAYDMSALGDFPGGRDMHHTARTYNNHRVVYKVENDVKTSGLKPELRDGWSETQRHLLTDYTQPDYLHEIVRASFEPLLIFLGGAVEDFTNKDHAYFANETVRKSIVAVNDHTTPRTVTFRWELVLDGKSEPAAHGEQTATVAPGGIAKLPIELTAPKVYKRTGGELRLMALLNDVLIKEDSFKLQFFPKRAAPDFSSSVATGLFDPEGKTEELLKKAGFPFRKVATLDDVKKCRLLIIGKNALKEVTPELLKQVESAGLIEKGLKLLIFEQKECKLGNFVFESPSYRNSFVRRPESPYLAGLKDEDFSNWRGSTDSVPEFVLSDEFSPHYPRSKWKCGNGGIVAGNVIRKPSYGNFSTIVDSGFNLMFAALMELKKGHGSVVFCQLDVTPRYLVDPVATKLTDNLLRIAGTPFVPVGPQRVAYLGDKENEKILQEMGLDYRKFTGSEYWMLNDYQVILLGRDAITEKNREKFRAFAEKSSATFVALPGAQIELLPGNLKLRTVPVYKARVPKNDPLFAGIPDADLYLREAQNLPVLDALPEWVTATEPALFARLDRGGKASAVIVMTLSPDNVKGLWNKEKLSRVWSAIFNNMNLGLGSKLELFTAPAGRHNKLKTYAGVLTPETWEIKFDPQNSGTVGDTAGFRPIKVGSSWESQGFQQKNPYYKYPENTPKSLIMPYDGYAWYRCKIKIPADWKGCKVTFLSSAMDDCDWTYWNGSKIGETTFENNKEPYKAPRHYAIPSDKIKFGAENTVMIRIFDRWGGGGITGNVKLIAEQPDMRNAWSPYIQDLDFYDVDAFHNW